MIPHPLDDGLVAIPQSAHALLSFQLADHWGNRDTPRPAPRAEVLTAVLLHDSGWDEREAPRRSADGSPIDFSSTPIAERETLWRSAVDRARIRGRLAAYLVSHHVSHLASHYSSVPHEAFLAGEEVRRSQLAEDMARDPRFRAALRPEQDAVNRAVVRLTDAIAVHLSVGSEGSVELPGLVWRRAVATLVLTRTGTRTYRLRPWPLTGRRLVLHTEGKRLARRTYESDAMLEEDWTRGETVHLAFTLLAPGAPAD